MSWGNTEPAMPNQHFTSSMGSPQQQGASRNAVLEELCALNPFHGNKAAPGKLQLQPSCFHQAAKTNRTATKPGFSGVCSGILLGIGRRGNTQNSFGAIYLFYCFCSTLESSSLMKCPPSTSSEHPGLCSCFGSKQGTSGSVHRFF